MPRLFITVIFVFLSACVAEPLKWNTNDYTVQSGDTLYSIAWRYEINPSELAKWNGISNSALIVAGQRLHTKNPSQSTRPTVSRWTPSNKTPVASNVKTVIVKKDETLYAIARKNNINVKQLIAYNNIKKPYVIKPGQRLRLSSQSKVASIRRDKKQHPVQKLSANKPNTQSIHWNWPIKGKLIKHFDKRLNDAKGIDIAGKEGNKIKAAAAGKVVYSGNGLISYGNLIIIKHNDLFLSAYAYNRKLLVKEGQRVKAGQAIAELGRTGTENPRLHFEIRKNGKPVNPIRYLPSS